MGLILNKTQEINDFDEYTACHECDLLLSHLELTQGQKAYCPRCGYLVFEFKEDSLNRTLAVALGGIIAFIPAVFSPMLGLEAMGFKSVASLADSIQIIFNNGLYLVAILLLLFTVLIPLGRLMLIMYLVIRINGGNFSQHLIRCYRIYLQFKGWGMLEVFLLGIIVSLYKLIVLANVVLGAGLFAFCFLLFSSILVTRLLDEHLVWKLLEKGKNDVNR